MLEPDLSSRPRLSNEDEDEGGHKSGDEGEDEVVGILLEEVAFEAPLKFLP